MAQVRQLEADNRTLREDLGFFEKLIPAAKTDGLAIRALQAEVLGGMRVVQAFANEEHEKRLLFLEFEHLM